MLRSLALLAPFLLLASPAQAGECLKAGEVKERDIRRHAEYLADACIRRETIREDGRRWQIYTITQGMPGPLWAVLHDNENAAFTAAVGGMRRHGGTILAVEAGEKRRFRGKDPNRNFGTKCGDARRYTAFIMGLAEAHGSVVAVHTNAPGFSGDGRGGSGHINIFRKSKVLQGRPAKRATGAFRSGDNFVLVPAKSEKRVTRRIRALNRQGVHAMFERVTKRGNDCSMSNHAVLSGFTDYVNVEAAHGEAKTAAALIEKALKAR